MTFLGEIVLGIMIPGGIDGSDRVREVCPPQKLHQLLLGKRLIGVKIEDKRLHDRLQEILRFIRTFHFTMDVEDVNNDDKYHVEHVLYVRPAITVL